jgi:hypothetical protein
VVDGFGAAELMLVEAEEEFAVEVLEREKGVTPARRAILVHGLRGAPGNRHFFGNGDPHLVLKSGDNNSAWR